MFFYILFYHIFRYCSNCCTEISPLPTNAGPSIAFLTVNIRFEVFGNFYPSGIALSLMVISWVDMIQEYVHDLLLCAHSLLLFLYFGTFESAIALIYGLSHYQVSYRATSLPILCGTLYHILHVLYFDNPYSSP